MANGIPSGARLKVPGLPGTWSVWSEADTPGGLFVVPSDDASRATAVKYARIRALYPDKNPTPSIELISTHPPLEATA